MHRLDVVALWGNGLVFSSGTLLGAVSDSPKSSDSVNASASHATVEFEKGIKPFLKKHCVSCHGPEKQKAKFTVHDIKLEDLDRWESIVENVFLDLMPPPEKPQPPIEERDAFVDWVKKHLENNGIKENREETSKHGNRLRHEDLFSGKYKGPAFSYSRLWRISQPIYDAISREFKATQNKAGMNGGPIPALVGAGDEEFSDYSVLRADDAVVRAMMLNIRKLAATIVRGKFQKGRFNEKTQKMSPPSYDKRHSSLRNLKLLRDKETAKESTLEAYDEAVNEAFKLLLLREPEQQELKRYRKFLVSSIKISDAESACEDLVKAILMSPESRAACRTSC